MSLCLLDWLLRTASGTDYSSTGAGRTLEQRRQEGEFFSGGNSKGCPAEAGRGEGRDQEAEQGGEIVYRLMKGTDTPLLMKLLWKGSATWSARRGGSGNKAF